MLLGFCGWLFLKAEDARRERAAVTEIERLGGIVRWDWQCTKLPNPQPPGPAWLKRWLGDNCFATVESVDATKRFGEEGLKHLKELRAVHNACLSESAVKDDDLRRLAGVRGLRMLLLDHTQISDAGLIHLEGLTGLEWLDLGETRVTDAGLKHLKGLKNLRVLGLGDTEITDTGLEELIGLPQLDTVDLLRTKVTPQGRDKLKQALPAHRARR